jgi:hypothetical protein
MAAEAGADVSARFFRVRASAFIGDCRWSMINKAIFHPLSDPAAGMQIDEQVCVSIIGRSKEARR